MNPRAPRPISRLRHGLLALEPRLLFDAAALATGAEALADGVAQAQAEEAVASVAPVPEGTPAGQASELVFVDAAVADAETLLASFESGVEVVQLDADSDGVEQIAAALEGRSGLGAVHVLAHGDVGRLQLGGESLTAASMRAEHRDALESIGQALTEGGDLLLYGCDFGSGAAGREAVSLLSRITGADVAASDDATGHAALGGDWQLESRAGSVETGVVVSAAGRSSWSSLLEAPPGSLDVELSFDEGAGTTANDSSAGGGSNDATLRLGAAFVTDGIRGGAVQLDGSNDEIHLPNSSDINLTTHDERSVSLWFNPDDTTGRQVLFEEGGGVRGLNIYLDGGDLYVGGWNEPAGQSGWNPGTFLSSSGIVAGQWHHAVVTLDGGPTVGPDALVGYLDGAEFGRGSGSQLWQHGGDNTLGRNGGTKFHTGDDGGGEAFAGRIDEFHLYNRTLSAGEVGELWNFEPTATDDLGSVSEDAPLAVAAGAGLLANDSDPDAIDTLSIQTLNGSAADVGTPVLMASGARLTLEADGSFVYDPNGAFESLSAGATAMDGFTVTISDGRGGTDSSDVELTIFGANEAPVAARQSDRVSDPFVRADVFDPTLPILDRDGPGALELHGSGPEWRFEADHELVRRSVNAAGSLAGLAALDGEGGGLVGSAFPADPREPGRLAQRDAAAGPAEPAEPSGRPRFQAQLELHADRFEQAARELAEALSG